MRAMSYVDLSFEVISRFVGPEDIPRDILKDILTRSFGTFRHAGRFSSSYHAFIIISQICNAFFRCYPVYKVGRILGA